MGTIRGPITAELTSSAIGCGNAVEGDLRRVKVAQRGDAERSGEFRNAGGVPGAERHRPVPGQHQEAVGVEAPGNVARIQPHERGHGRRLEVHHQSRLILPHFGLQGGRVGGGDIRQCLQLNWT